MTEVRIRNVDDWVVDSIRTRAAPRGKASKGRCALLHQEAMRPKLELANELRQMRDAASQEIRHLLRLDPSHP